MSEDESAGEGPEDERDGKRERERHFCCFLASNRMTVDEKMCHICKKKKKKKGSDINQQTKLALLSIQINFRWPQFWPTG